MLHRFAIASCAALALSACADVDTVSRNLPLAGPGLQGAEAPAAMRNYALADLVFTAPEGLTISEANRYYPLSDIVWRGDAAGDRRAQIGAMFQEAANRNRAQARAGQRAVIADITLVRFHGVTERTRYTIGGVYSIKFDLTIRDAATGVVIEPTRRIIADLEAPGGEAAVQLEQSGQTERVRVTDHLTRVLREQALI